jgi:hypothetical protein
LNERQILFVRALHETETLCAPFPELPTIVSIDRQLQYLIALESGPCPPERDRDARQSNA